jgi:hypothetical protein
MISYYLSRPLKIPKSPVMGLVLRYFLLSSFSMSIAVLAGFNSAAAANRSIASGSERSLLYWRYLCENSPQVETVANGWRELSCPSQGWKIKAKENEDLVKEVNEKDSNGS